MRFIRKVRIWIRAHLSTLRGVLGIMAWFGIAVVLADLGVTLRDWHFWAVVLCLTVMEKTA